MGRKSKRRVSQTRDAPKQQRSSVQLCSADAWTIFCNDGYRPLSQCPEVQMCVGVYADLVANMTIHIMQNTPQGDVRIRDGLSAKLDIAPNSLMTHQTFMANLVRTLLLEGNQITVPVYDREGLLSELIPLPPGRVSLMETGDGSYMIRAGELTLRPDEVLHFAVNPDPERPWLGTGYKASLRDVVGSLRQAGATKRALLENPAPSLIIKVDGYDDELQTPEGRERISQRYLSTSAAGRPLMIQADAFDVQQVAPMTMSDLAIDKNLELDKRSVAAIMGVPAFLVGVGEFKSEEFDWFVATRVMAVARIIEQEMTKKLIYAPDRYIRLNSRSLLNYNLSKVVEMSSELLDRLVVGRNEVRDWIGMEPREDMEELLALENYIPATMLGQQKKLTGGDSDAQ